MVVNLADDDLASQVLREVRGPFFAVFVTVQILFYLLAAVAIRRGWGGSRALAATQVVAMVSGAIAIATFLAQLVPWWNLPAPMAGVILHHSRLRLRDRRAGSRAGRGGRMCSAR